MNIKQSARLATFLLIAVFAVWAIDLLINGLPHTSFPEVQPGATLPPGQTVYRPYFGAVYSLATLLLVGVGLLKDKWLPLAWAGVMLHLIFGGLLIWSMGLLYMAAAGVLAVPLGILHWRVSQQQRWLLAAWAGVGVAC